MHGTVTLGFVDDLAQFGNAFGIQTQVGDERSQIARDQDIELTSEILKGNVRGRPVAIQILGNREQLLQIKPRDG